MLAIWLFRIAGGYELESAKSGFTIHLDDPELDRGTGNTIEQSEHWIGALLKYSSLANTYVMSYTH